MTQVGKQNIDCKAEQEKGEKSCMVQASHSKSRKGDRTTESIAQHIVDKLTKGGGHIEHQCNIKQSLTKNCKAELDLETRIGIYLRKACEKEHWLRTPFANKQGRGADIMRKPRKHYA